ncbi:tRNA (cytosine-5-)-methyltransferase ncl1 [Mycoemilia scoparia]|uniref:tRNA (Cytosine-5-)-methyltransferase ncl1 n=1 Tax=Mycoemilia scoparia TaxID=417184 RepID=A0A9W8DPZ3_9FUNG|nr:tRNA (cytosine-5-)-methyltransferase ncl1 [Mycoemilia scoparia]
MGRRGGRPNWKNKRGKSGGERQQRKRDDGRVDIVRQNDDFEKYYKAQDILCEEEWSEFMKTFVTTLPTSFRITGTRSMAEEIRDLIETEYIPYVKGAEVDGEKVTPPAPIPWYPNNFGWQFEIPRIALKKSPALNKFHKFLVTEAEVGNISRQEAVSMIPPLMLDVKPHHAVLDMCAAPGSKTAQLLEAIHAEEKPDEIPAGFVIANDADYKRACLLVHQTNRLRSPCIVVTNHSGERFPNIEYNDSEGHKKAIQFDRILCDVPCSGDGTMRKNPQIWKKWNVRDGINLHNIQTKILARSMYLLKEGGRLVYSTCSLNPMENEAVVADALNTFGDAIKLVDVSDQLPLLKRSPGLTSWKVMTRDGCLYQTHEEMVNEKDPEDSRKYIKSLFAPKNVSELGLDKCLRIYPHQQDTGGFFVAVFEKTKPISKLERRDAKFSNEAKSIIPAKRAASPGEGSEKSAETKDESTIAETDSKDDDGDNKKKLPKEYRPDQPREDPPLKENPFIFMEQDHESLQAIRKHFNISDKMQYNGFMIRDDKTFRTIYLVSNAVRFLLTQGGPKLRTVNTGIRMFDKNGLKEGYCPFRLTAEGMTVVYPFTASEDIIHLTYEDLKTILLDKNPLMINLSPEVQNQVERLTNMGSIIASFDPKTEKAIADKKLIEEKLGHHIPNLFTQIILPVWRGSASLSVHLNKNELRSMVLRVLGEKADTGKEEKTSGNSTPAPKTDTEKEDKASEDSTSVPKSETPAVEDETPKDEAAVFQVNDEQ